jgi:monofunctional biosynthetic peptidoglycan transglycosylase
MAVDTIGPDAEPRRSLPVRMLIWIGTHKVKSIVIILGGFLLYELATIPFFSIARLRYENPTETALMRQRLREASGQGKNLRVVHTWVPLSRISKNLIDAVIVAEDGTFYTHGGIDWFEVRESIEKNIDKRRAARGASTITQQLAKNLYLSTSKDPVRKLKELIITLLLESQLRKERILEIYLNVIEWGKGVYGVEAAAIMYFGKHASELTLDEAVRFAAVIPSPLRHRPNEDTRYVERRKQIVLRRMQARYDAYLEQPEESLSNILSDSLLVVPEDTMFIDSTVIEEEDGGNGS